MLPQSNQGARNNRDEYRLFLELFGTFSFKRKSTASFLAKFFLRNGTPSATCLAKDIAA
jgi:hypothetical protein